MIRFGPIEHHIEDLVHTRLCDGRPASDADISSSDWSALRDARKDTTLCPDCQDRMHPVDIQPELYGMGRHTTAHLYAVPVLATFGAIRNCSHCRRCTMVVKGGAMKDHRGGEKLYHLAPLCRINVRANC